MKYIANLFWAFLLSWIPRSVIYEHITDPATQQYTNWLFEVPLEIQILFLWGLFSFPDALGRVATLIGNSILKALTYVYQAIGQFIEYIWKYRFGKIIIAIGVVYLLCHFIF